MVCNKQKSQTAQTRGQEHLIFKDTLSSNCQEQQHERYLCIRRRGKREEYKYQVLFYYSLNLRVDISTNLISNYQEIY